MTFWRSLLSWIPEQISGSMNNDGVQEAKRVKVLILEYVSKYQVSTTSDRQEDSAELEMFDEMLRKKKKAANDDTTEVSLYLGMDPISKHQDPLLW